MGISLGLLNSTDAAQKGAKKKGTFLQKAGRMLDPYLPAGTRTSFIGKTATNTDNDVMDQCFHVSGTHQQPLLGWGQSDGPSRSPPTAAPGCGTTSCVDRKSTGFIMRTLRTPGRRVVMSLPFEHAVDDNEEEEVVKDALPVRHHHSVGRAHVRLALKRHGNSTRWI